MGLGAVFVNQLVKWGAKLQEDLEKMLDKAQAANKCRYLGSLLTLNFLFLFCFILNIVYYSLFLILRFEEY